MLTVRLVLLGAHMGSDEVMEGIFWRTLRLLINLCCLSFEARHLLKVLLLASGREDSCRLNCLVIKVKNSALATLAYVLVGSSSGVWAKTL